jgi:hypothetical protein
MFVMNMHHARNYSLCEKLKCGNDVALCDYSGQIECNRLCTSDNYMQKWIINLFSY